MIITIVAIVLGVVMTLGGLVPNIANGIAENRLDAALNHPKHLRVQVHPEAPSFSLAGGVAKYTEIEADDFEISDLPVEHLMLRVDTLSVARSGDKTSLREPTQGMVRVRLNQDGINHFLGSDTFRRMLDEMRKRQKLASKLDAELDSLSVGLHEDRVQIDGQASTMGGFFVLPFSLSGQLRLDSERQLSVRNVEASTLGRPLAPDMISAILDQLNPVLDLAKLSQPDMQMYFRELQVHQGYLELVGEARLKQLPF